jgi:uncharacterized Rmd1/YagE family protein
MYEGVLRLYFIPERSHNYMIEEGSPRAENINKSDDYFQGSPDGYETNPIADYKEELKSSNLFHRIDSETELENDVTNGLSLSRQQSNLSEKEKDINEVNRMQEEQEEQSASMLCLTGGKEVFVFDFGAVVFWGFKNGEEEELLELIKDHVVKDRLSQQEFEEVRVRVRVRVRVVFRTPLLSFIRGLSRERNKTGLSTLTPTLNPTLPLTLTLPGPR